MQLIQITNVVQKMNASVCTCTYVRIGMYVHAHTHPFAKIYVH